MHIEQLLWTSGERIRTETWDQGHRPEPMNLGRGPRGVGSCGGVGRIRACRVPETERKGDEPEGVRMEASEQVTGWTFSVLLLLSSRFLGGVLLIALFLLLCHKGAASLLQSHLRPWWKIMAVQPEGLKCRVEESNAEVTI